MRKLFLAVMATAMVAILIAGCGGSGTSLVMDADGYGKTTMANGITVLVNHDASTSLSAGRILIGGGILSETANNNGITNLMVNMLLKGNDKMSASEITERLDFLGASVNASCYRDYCAISFASLTENFDETMSIISESILHPTFPEDELEKLKIEVGGQLKSASDNQSETSSRLFWETAYGEQGYGLYPAGMEESVNRTTVADVRAHYERIVGGKNIILSISTDLDPAAAISILENHFAKVKPEAVAIPRPSLTLEDNKEGFISFDRNQSFIYMGAFFSHLQPNEVPILMMVHQVMGGGVGSRLWFLRQKEKLAYAVYTQYAFDKYDAMFRAAIGTDTSKVQTAVASLNREWDKLVSDGITEDELADAKINLKNSMMYSFDLKSNRANNMAYYEYVGYGPKFFLNVVSRADKITVTDVNNFVKNNFTPDRKFISIVGKK